MTLYSIVPPACQSMYHESTPMDKFPAVRRLKQKTVHCELNFTYRTGVRRLRYRATDLEFHRDLCYEKTQSL